MARETPRPPGASVPAYNAEAEEAVLGAMLLDRGAIAAARAAGLEARHLYRPALATIAGAIFALDDAGEPVDSVTVQERLRAEGLLEEVGGPAVFVSLIAGVPATMHAARYAGIVVELAAERGALGATLEAVEVLRGPGETAGKLARVAQLLEAVEPATPPADSSLYAAGLELLEVLEEGEARLSTGLRDLDAFLAGGLAPASLTVLGARPGMGKSSLAQQIAEHAAATVPVLFISAEMSRTDVALRAVVARTGLRTDQVLPTPAPADMGRVVEAVASFASLRLEVHDGPHDLARIRALAQGMARSPDGLGLVVVDYLQLLTGPTAERREREVAALSTGLKHLAQRLGVPVLLVAQLNRSLEQRADKRPVLADLRDSGQVEQDADVAVLIYRDEVYNPDSADRGVAELHIGKNRHGPTGTVRCHFRGERMRFAPLAPVLRSLPGGQR